MRRAVERKYVLATLVAGAAIQVLVLQAFGVFGGGSPTELAPSPMPLAILSFIGLGVAALAIPVLAFWAWGLPLFRGAAEFPMRSSILVVVAVATSALWLIVGKAWEYYEGAMFAVSGSLVLLLVAAVVWCRLRPSFLVNLLAHALLFGWLGSFAFPWVGEVP